FFSFARGPPPPSLFPYTTLFRSRPQAMCLEEVYTHRDYPRTSVLMGHARGVICLAARLASIPVVSFPAKRVKQSVTGNGNASKTQVQRAVQNFFSLACAPHPPDVADALAVAMCFADSRRGPPNGWRPRRGSRRVSRRTRL